MDGVQRKQRILRLFRDAMEAVEEEVDRPDGIGISAHALDEVNHGVSVLITELLDDPLMRGVGYGDEEDRR